MCLGQCDYVTVLLAGAGLKGKEKKAHEAKKIEALGGKAAKARVTPYNILIGLKKKGAVREKRQKAEVRPVRQWVAHWSAL